MVASEVVWVTIDGKAVPVSDPAAFGGSADNGKVVFCNRALGLKTSGFTETEMITLSINTTEANAFNWMAFNVGNEYDSGSNTHTIAVWASVVQATATSLANQISF